MFYFHQKYLDERNTTIAEFNQKYDAAFSGLFSGNGFNGNTKIIDVILNLGDEIFKKNELYTRLISRGKLMHELLESEDNPYPFRRGSFD